MSILQSEDNLREDYFRNDNFTYKYICFLIFTFLNKYEFMDKMSIYPNI
jgi:hypothetical protein